MGCSAAIAAMAGGRVGNLVFANPNEAGPAAANDNILVTIFLRGGCDGLSMIAPYNDPIYVAKRGDILREAPTGHLNGQAVLAGRGAP